jgi:hypothetical protein
MTTYTQIEIGNMSKEKAQRVYDRVEGKTYMNFHVVRGVIPGPERCVTVETSYEADREDIIGMLLFLLASEL